MKQLSRIILLLAISALSLNIAAAQDDEAEEAEETEAVALVLVQAAESGTFEDNDDTITLTLDNVEEAMDFVVTAPALGAGQYRTLEFDGDWEFANADRETLLEITAILNTEEASYMLSLTDASYEDGVATYTGTLDMIEVFDPEADDDKAELPESFDGGTLFISLDTVTFEALVSGRETRINSTRDSSFDPSCSPFPSCLLGG
jgi:hypothetical protein